MTDNVITHYCIIILAAGNSRRMGRSKLFLEFKNETLLAHAINAAKETGNTRVLVISGNEREKTEEISSVSNVMVYYNEFWKDGISSSIRSGMQKAMLLWPEIDGILFMVADQPYINQSILKRIVSRQQESGIPMVASGYSDTVGTPAIFHKSVFPSIDQLTGDEGAKKILTRHPEELLTVPFDAGAIDIDTPADYEYLISTEKNSSL